ncbi:MAG: acyl carrier protein [Flavobacterium sp.]|uniref:acyl carrier protein n=1 Tax=Flavobacterium sp. TaxID=239 RepID=UPI001204B7CD|nr:acyl carrier protein [Flavobacterium sp.]RZJ65405.1 MAG: acyl carrier protein [Flavobacterium sp.]
MDKAEFIEKVKEQFLDPVDDLGFDDNFRDFGSYDSLTGMTIMVMIKDEFGYDITEADYRNQKTIQQLFDLVTSRTA